MKVGIRPNRPSRREIHVFMMECIILYISFREINGILVEAFEKPAETVLFP